ncbi:hypothetical protein GPK90_08500 [Clostridium sp. MCC344]|nr:hypothetical protein [Clostridium sp. MCC344]MBT9789373.1 hypothetical protein [Clostridium sp. MCC344]
MYQMRWRRISWSADGKPEREKFIESLAVISAAGRNLMFAIHVFVCMKVYESSWEA